jgi:membrane dipeptidase
MVVDGHSDILIDVGKRWSSGERGRLGDFHVPRMLDGGVTGAWCPIAVDNPSHPGDPYERALRTLEAVHDEVERAAGSVAIVHDASTFESAMRRGQVALFLGMEGGMPLEGRPERVEAFARSGLRWIGLTWNARNEIGDGLGAEHPTGLTAAGAEIVAEMERLGMVIDLTHASAPLVTDVADTTTAPLAVTHSNSRQLCEHVRNLDDAQLALIRERDGIVGLNLYPALLTRTSAEATMADILRHARYLVEHVGPHGVTFGFDFIDYDLDAMAAGLAASSVDYGDSTAYPEGAEDTTQVGNIIEALRAADWSDDIVQNVAWRNHLRFIAAVQAAGGHAA